MRRFQIPNAALAAGLALLLCGCSGETPTAPTPPPGPGAGGSGPCSTVISLSAFTLNPTTATPVRATVTKAGVPVPDGSSVQFTTDLGFFGEIGLQTISKVITDGVADVTVFSLSPGTAHVTAVFDCARAQLNLQFSGTPAVGPFISSVFPTTGTCAGGDVITILGGRFTGTIDVRFGGASGSIVSSTATQIVVRSPARALRNPAVPETVDLVVIADGVSSAPVSFTFVGIDPLQKIFISSISPADGIAAGGDPVLINGGHFGTTIATTRVTFCGRPGQITSQTDQQITVQTPASPEPLEVCDVVVTRDLGLCSQQSATSTQQFTFSIVLTPVIFSISPTTGPNDASTRVTIFGDGFQFPMQVFMTGGSCPGTVEATASDIAVTTIVFKTPVATGPNACLAGSAVSISIRNPVTGKTATSPTLFTYFAPPVPPPPPAPSIATTTLPDGIRGTAYSAALVATGGTPPFTWTVVSGVLPGLSVSAGGVIAGIPTTSGIFPFSVKVTDTAGGTATAVLSINVLAPPLPSISTTSPLRAGDIGTPYNVTLAATGGVPPFTWSVVSGVPPSGLNLSGAGVISGTPLGPAGSTTFTVKVTDFATGTATASFTIPINPAPAITTPSVLPAGTNGTAYSTTISATGGTLPYTSWAVVAGALPANLSINASTGLISGTIAPLVPPVTFNFTIRVIDTAGGNAAAAFSLTVN